MWTAILLLLFEKFNLFTHVSLKNQNLSIFTYCTSGKNLVPYQIGKFHLVVKKKRLSPTLKGPDNYEQLVGEGEGIEQPGSSLSFIFILFNKVHRRGGGAC